MSVPFGDIIIPTDQSPNAPAYIDRTGTWIASLPASWQAELGDILPGGVVCLAHTNDSDVLLGYDIYDNTQALIATHTPSELFSMRGFIGAGFSPVCGNGSNLFYVACNYSGPGHPSAQVRAIDKTGNIQATTWNPNTQGNNDIQAMAPSYDNTILYFALDVGGDSPIYKHDLVNDVDLGVWLPGDSINANQIGKNIFVMPSGNILVTYQPNIGIDTWEIREYDTSANLLHTFSLPTNVDHSFIFTALDWYDQTVFWVRTFPSLILSTFYKVKVSDFSQLATFNLSIGNGSNKLPLSCPLLIANNAAPPEANLTIAKTSSSTFLREGTGSFTLTVTNTGGLTWNGVTTVTETLPTGLTLVSMSGTGWTVVGNVATRNDSLGAGLSFPTLTVNVSVNSDAPSSMTNLVDVNGTQNTLGVSLASISGIYQLVFGKLQDTVYINGGPTTQQVAIPNPSANLPMVGD